MPLHSQAQERPKDNNRPPPQQDRQNPKRSTNTGLTKLPSSTYTRHPQPNTTTSTHVPTNNRTASHDAVTPSTTTRPKHNQALPRRPRQVQLQQQPNNQYMSVLRRLPTKTFTTKDHPPQYQSLAHQKARKQKQHANKRPKHQHHTTHQRQNTTTPQRTRQKPQQKEIQSHIKSPTQPSQTTNLTMTEGDGQVVNKRRHTSSSLRTLTQQNRTKVHPPNSK